MKVLVADDDLDNRTIAATVLEASDYTVFLASNGLEALALAEKELPEIILMDLSMPKLNGWEATQRLKLNPQLKNIPVIAFTAHAMVGDDKRALQAGCDDYLTKPCAPRKILEKIREWEQKLKEQSSR